MNPKTRRIIRIICLAACAISLVMLFLLLSWFYIRGAEFRLKYYASHERRRPAALARDAELVRKIRAYVGYGLNHPSV